MMEQPSIFSNLDMFIQKKALPNVILILKYCHVRIEIENSELGVIGNFMMRTLESLRLRLCDSNIANRCKISYNPSLVVVYFYINCTLYYLYY